jgi:TctA family transporter
MLEENFRRAMLIYRGNLGVFVTQPISAVLVGLISLFFAWQLFSFLRAQWKPRVAQPAKSKPSVPV